jgi:ribosomal protein L7Ae-like RNA K-turn-binding protein
MHLKQPGTLLFLSLAQKAGKTAGGETAAQSAIRSGKASLVLIASDASDNTKKKFINQCRTRKVPYLVTSEKAALGRAVGKSERSVLAILDESFAEGFRVKLEKERAQEERSVL